MPTVTLIKYKGQPVGATHTIPMGGRIYTFAAGKAERNIPVAVAVRCLRVNERLKKLVFQVDDMPVIVQNVSGEQASKPKNQASVGTVVKQTAARRVTQGTL